MEGRSKTALISCPLPGVTSRFWSCAALHVSIWLYHRRFRPRVRVSVTVASCGTIAVSLRGYKVHPEEPLRLIGNQYSQRATTARFQWPRAIDSPSNRPLSIQGCRRTEGSGLAKGRCSTFPESHSEPVRPRRPRSIAQFCRTRRPARFFCRGMRIRRAGTIPVRQLAGDKRIGHQLLGTRRRSFTIRQVSHSSETG